VEKIECMKIDQKSICSGFPFYPHIIINMFLARNVSICAEAKKRWRKMLFLFWQNIILRWKIPHERELWHCVSISADYKKT